jgi:hypothetical protein
VDTTPDRNVQLEDRETRRGTDPSECDLVCFDAAFSDPIDDSTD